MQNVLIQGKLNTDRTKVQEVLVNSSGQISTTAAAGELSQFNRLAGGAIASYFPITTQTTSVVKNGTGILYGVYVVTGVATSTVTVYDNTAGSGQKLIDTASCATSGTFIPAGAAGMGVICTTGITAVTATANPNIILLYV